jgi:hypothetical protein
VRDVIYNELQAPLRDVSAWCFHQQHQQDGEAAKTSEVCQTQSGEIDRLVAINGRELTSAELGAEDSRIQAWVNHPEQVKARQKKQREDAEQARNMLRIFPEAFRFECAGQSGNLVTLQFTPNPNFHPPTRPAMVFHHMEGTLIVDASQKRLVEINGRLVSEVKFAGGLLGHLDKNGTFRVQQQEVAPGHWDMTFMRVRMDGKALFFKTISVREEKSTSGYRPLPQSATLRDAAFYLQKDFAVRTASTSGK